MSKFRARGGVRSRAQRDRTRNLPSPVTRIGWLTHWRAEVTWSKFSENSFAAMIRKLKSGGYRLYSRKRNATTGKRKNLGTFRSLGAARKHEREVQYFKRHS